MLSQKMTLPKQMIIIMILVVWKTNVKRIVNKVGLKGWLRLLKKCCLVLTVMGKNQSFWFLYQSQKNHEAIGFGKPGGHTKDSLIKHNFEGEQLRKQDVGGLLVLICGTNDVVCNKAQKGISDIKTPQTVFSVKLFSQNFQTDLTCQIGPV